MGKCPLFPLSFVLSAKMSTRDGKTAVIMMGFRRMKIQEDNLLIIDFDYVCATGASVSAYSGKDAAAYAKKHAKKYNTAYPAWDADCTNFVSQCVKAGGISTKSIPKTMIKRTSDTI